MIMLCRIVLVPATQNPYSCFGSIGGSWGGASRDDTNSGCVADWCSTRFVHFVTFLTVRSQRETSLCDVNTQRLMFISLFTLGCGPKKSTWWKIGLHLTFKANWNTLNGTKFERKRIHFIKTLCCRHCRCCYSMLVFKVHGAFYTAWYREGEIVPGANPRWDICCYW